MNFIKSILLSLVLVFSILDVNAQMYKASSSKVHFYSSAPIEDIEASNEKGSSVIDLSNGEVAFSIPVNQFSFEKSLMKEHFNENYLESDKYPKIVFTGVMSTTDLKVGSNEVTVKGEMNLHGVKKKMKVTGTVNYTEKKMHVHSKFAIKLADYKIKIPRVMFHNIAEVIDVIVDFIYEPI